MLPPPGLLALSASFTLAQALYISEVVRDFLCLEVIKYLCMYSRCAQDGVQTLNGKQGCSVSMSNDTNIHALYLLLGGLNVISMVDILGDAHIAFITSTRVHQDRLIVALQIAFRALTYMRRDSIFLHMILRTPDDTHDCKS